MARSAMMGSRRALTVARTRWQTYRIRSQIVHPRAERLSKLTSPSKGNTAREAD